MLVFWALWRVAVECIRFGGPVSVAGLSNGRECGMLNASVWARALVWGMRARAGGSPAPLDMCGCGCTLRDMQESAREAPAGLLATRPAGGRRVVRVSCSKACIHMSNANMYRGWPRGCICCRLTYVWLLLVSVREIWLGGTSLSAPSAARQRGRRSFVRHPAVRPGVAYDWRKHQGR